MAFSPGPLDPAALAGRMLDWYDANRRILPWRAAPGTLADPYAVWLSEIMLQQTTVATVGPYFDRFMALWPRVEDLAAAPLDPVLHAWQGLGYYARARNLHACARVVAEAHGGRFPDTEEGLLRLPGIGPYTAAAIASIAFGRPATVLDGNIERVMARLHAVEQPLPDAKPILRRHAGLLTPAQRPGDYAQAVMDLGATICTPRKPRCLFCPWSAACRARALGDPERFPLKRAKPARPVRRGIAFWITRLDGAILLRRRPPKGLLGGMMEIPSTPWRPEPWSAAEAQTHAPLALGTTRLLPGGVEHAFTHFHLEISVLAAAGAGSVSDGIWVRPDALGDHALPTVMKKIARFVLAGG